jgi:NAD(P)-dependent dehydrogenase (short-subunit alcohol dehydrogenase family)
VSAHWTDGKVVLVTGAASGIGRSLAVLAARRGATLALSDVDEAGLDETAVLVKEAGAAPPRTEVLDVRDRAAWRRHVDGVVEDLGRLDAVVNNAGVALQGDVEQISYDDLEWVMDIDFWGVVNGTKETLPHLIASGDGRLVNVSSLFGLMAVPGQSAYNAAKFAVRGFTEALRQEMLVNGHPVKVTCVHPGGVRTAIARNARAVGVDQAAAADFFDRSLARTSADSAARQILDGMEAGRARVVVGLDAKLLDLQVRLLGPAYQRVVALLAGAQRRRIAP